MSKIRQEVQAQVAARREAATIPTEADVTELGRVLGGALEHTERLVQRVADVDDRWMEDGVLPESVTFADLGVLWTLADHIRTDASCLNAEARRLDNLLGALDMIRMEIESDRSESAAA